jgi:hypothetical protein
MKKKLPRTSSTGRFLKVGESRRKEVVHKGVTRAGESWTVNRGGVEETVKTSHSSVEVLDSAKKKYDRALRRLAKK